MTYNYIERIPTEPEYNKLRDLAGWGPLDPETVEKSLPNFVYGVAAEHQGELVAFARVVWDGGLCFYIQEIIVHPDHQRKGIASRFMEYILDFFEKAATRRSHIGVLLEKTWNFSMKNMDSGNGRYPKWVPE